MGDAVGFSPGSFCESSRHQWTGRTSHEAASDDSADKVSRSLGIPCWASSQSSQVFSPARCVASKGLPSACLEPIGPRSRKKSRRIIPNISQRYRTLPLGACHVRALMNAIQVPSVILPLTLCQDWSTSRSSANRKLVQPSDDGFVLPILHVSIPRVFGEVLRPINNLRKAPRPFHCLLFLVEKRRLEMRTGLNQAESDWSGGHGGIKDFMDE